MTAAEKLGNYKGDLDLGSIEYLMIEFAKEKARDVLQAAADKAEAIEGWNTGFSGSAASVNKESILNAYDVNQIK